MMPDEEQQEQQQERQNGPDDDDEEEDEEERRSNGQSRTRAWIDDFAKRKKTIKESIKRQYVELQTDAFAIPCPDGAMPNTITKNYGLLEEEPEMANGKAQKDHWDEGEMEVLCRFWFGHLKARTEVNGCRTGSVEKLYTSFHNRLMCRRPAKFRAENA